MTAIINFLPIIITVGYFVPLLPHKSLVSMPIYFAFSIRMWDFPQPKENAGTVTNSGSRMTLPNDLFLGHNTMDVMKSTPEGRGRTNFLAAAVGVFKRDRGARSPGNDNNKVGMRRKEKPEAHCNIPLLDPRRTQGNGPEEVRELIHREYAAHFPDDLGWIQEEKLRPLINYMLNLWKSIPYEGSYRRDRPREESFIHEFRVLHTVYNAPETPPHERVLSALVGGGHDVFENARDFLDTTLPFLDVAKLLCPEPKDHYTVARAWELVTDPKLVQTAAIKKSQARIKHQQEMARKLDQEGYAGILVARVKVADKSDNSVTWYKDIQEGRLVFKTAEEIMALRERTAANMVVIENIGHAKVLPDSQINRALLHSEALLDLLGTQEPMRPKTSGQRLGQFLRQVLNR